MIYLASPYTDPNQAVREQRFQAACAVTARMMLEGHVVYSPVVHGHPLTTHGLPIDWSFWEYFDLRHLEYCNDILVLMLDGWTESAGVRAEIEKGTELGKPIWYRAPLGPWTPTLAALGGGGRDVNGTTANDKTPARAKRGASWMASLIARSLPVGTETDPGDQGHLFRLVVVQPDPLDVLVAADGLPRGGCHRPPAVGLADRLDRSGVVAGTAGGPVGGHYAVGVDSHSFLLSW